MSSCTHGSDAVCSHASHVCAAGRHLLRLSMCARRFAPNAHASLRICLPAHTARTLYVVTPRDAPRSGRLARFTPARGRSITTPSQHVRPALRADRPRFAALLSSCAQGSALLIFSASLCQYKCCALFLPQLAAHLSPLRRCSALFPSSSAKPLPPSATGSGRDFAPSGAREDPARRTPRFMHILSRLTGAAGCHSPYCTDFPFLI